LIVFGVLGSTAWIVTVVLEGVIGDRKDVIVVEQFIAYGFVVSLIPQWEKIPQ
jgi:hypothetical protein